ncbi:MAG: M48 family metalloprotease [Candidatus Omnitrophica bacterium]|nr:M48 family metalloprotease [Candidatus Omnitrophota bacterium]
MKFILYFSLISLIFMNGCFQSYFNTATQEQETYFYSTEKEIKIGASLSYQVERTYKPDNDLLIQQRVKDVGQKIAAVNERRDIQYHFKVLDDKKINAFALPGGYVYIFRGLWDKIKESDGMIAAVLAHEVGHVAARHSIKRAQSSIGMNVLAVLVGVSSDIDSYSRSKALAGIYELMLSYSREDELQADILAVRYLQKTGYDPVAIIDVLKLLQETERERPVQSQHIHTHPYITDRMKVVKEQINRGSVGFNDYINAL